MKRLFKKGLSLFLAVIMLMSVLPMNAMAVMIMDRPGSERVEVPVLDKTDRVVDTHARPGSSSSSGDRPEVPTPGGDESGEPSNASSVTIKAGTGNNLLEGRIEGADSLTVLVLPDFTLAAGDPSAATLATTDNGKLVTDFGIAQATPSWDNVTIIDSGNASNEGCYNWPHVYYRWQNITSASAPNADYYIDKDGNFGITGGLIGTTSASHGSVASLTKDLAVFADQYKDTIYINGAKWNGTDPLPFKMYAITSGTVVDIQELPLSAGELGLKIKITPKVTQAPRTVDYVFAKATLTNQTGEDKTFNLELASQKASPATAAQNGTVGAPKSAGNTNYALTQTTVTVRAGESVDIDIKISNVTGLVNNNWWNYQVYAQSTTAGDAEISDTAAVKIGTATYTPTVYLVDTAGNPVSENGHTVVARWGAADDDTKKLDLPTKTGNAYTTSGTLSTANNCQVYVDGVPTGEYVRPYFDGTTLKGEATVVLYKLTTQAKDSTGKALTGSFTKTIGGTTTSCEYFATGAVVSVTAADPLGKNAFEYWTDHASGTAVTVDVTMNSNKTATAVYGATFPVTLTTRTRTNAAGDWVDSSINTYTIELKDGTGATPLGMTSKGSGKYEAYLSPGKEYSIWVNQCDTGLVFKDEDGYRDHIVNLCSVKKTEVGGDTTTSYIVLPWDGQNNDAKKPENAARGDLIFYYPEGVEITVDITHKATADVLLSLVDDQDSNLSATSTKFTVKKVNQQINQTVTATYGFTGIVRVLLGTPTVINNANLFHQADLSSIFYVKDGDDPAVSTNRGTFTRGTGTAAANNPGYYTANLPEGTYNVYINGFYVGQIKNGAVRLDVNGRVVSVVQGKLSTTGDDGVTGISATTSDTYIPNGKDITIAGTNPGGGKAFEKWTEVLAESSSTTTDLAQSETDTYTVTIPASTAAAKTVTLTAVYAAANGSVTVNVNLNDAKDTVNRHEVKLSTASGSLTGAVPLTEGSNNSIYTNGSVPQGKYYIFVDDVCVDTTGFTLAAGGSEEKTVDYYTVTISAGTGVKTGTAKVTGGTANSVNGGYLKNTTGIVLEAEPATNYDVNAATWADQMTAPATSVSGTGSTSGGKAIYTLSAIDTETAYEVSFDKIQVVVTINMKKNGSAWADSNIPPVLNKSDTNQGSPITLTLNAAKTAYTATVDAGETYYIWPQVTTTGGAYVATPVTLTFTAAEVTAKAASRDLNYYDLTVTADRTVDAAAVVDQDLTTATAAAASEGPTAYYTDTVVKIDAAPGNPTNYAFSAWETSTNGTAPASTSTASTTVTLKAETTLTAKFDEKAYTSKLTVKVDSETDATKWTSGDVVSATLVDKDGNAITGVTVTRDTASGKDLNTWTATGVPTNAGGKGPFKWVVTTLSGAYDSTDITSDATKRNATMDLFTVTVANGAGNDNSYKPTITGKDNTARQRAIGPKSTSFTLAANPKSGFTQKAHSNGWTKSVSTYGTVGSNTLYTINNDTTGTQELTPNFTYSVTLVPTRDDSATPVVAMTSGITSVSAGSTAATENSTTHKWTVTGLEPGTTGTSYTVSVNGFASSITIDTDDAGNEVPVQMYEIKTVKDPTTADGNAYVKLGASFSGTATAVYVPKGASTTTSGDTQVSVQATAGTDYRLRTVAKDGSGNTTWTNLDGAGAGSDTATTKVTFSSIGADIEVTAHYVEQFTVKLQQSNGGSSTIKGETVTTPTGSTWNPTTAAASATGTIDKDNIIKITAAAATGYQLKGWKITAGDLYGSESGGTLSTQINVSANQDATDTALYLSTDTEVFVKVTADTTVTAVYEAGTYEVVITVKKDNTAYKGLKVELKNQNSSNTSYTGTNALTDNSDGTYTVRALAGTYDIYVDGTNVGAATTDTEKDIEVKTTGAPFTKEVNYYTVDLVTDPATIASADEVYVDHNATVRSSGRVTSIIMLAKSAPYTTNVAATENNYDVTGATTHYRFDNWSVTAPASNGGSMGDTADPTTTYQLPAEGTLTANSNITASKHITLTATFQAQWKVTVSNADGTNGGTITKPANSTVYNVVGTWNTASGGVVYVDKGSSLPLVTSPKTTMRVQGWKEESTSGKVAFVKTSDSSSITASGGYYVDTAARNNITATPSGDVEVKVYWERDAFTGTINLVRADGTTGYTEDNTKVYIDLKDAASTGKDATEHTNHDSSTKHVIQTVTSGTATNAWTDTMLLNGHTYQVWVNGYNTGKTLTNTSATTTVKMFELTLDVKIDGATDDGAGTDYAPTDTKTQSTFKADYAPNNTAGTNAFFVPEASSDVVINLAAQAAGSGLRYRSASADGAGNTFWTAGKGSLASADNASTTLTLDTDATGMDDVTIYANYISVLVLKVQAATPASGNVAGGSVKITAGGTIASDKLSTNIDKDKIATVVATPSTTTAMDAYAFVDWIIATTTPAGSGKWATSASDATEDTGARTATDFFAPSANTTLEASFKNLKATGTTITGDTTTYPTANYSWNNSTGLAMTVKAGYAAGLSAPVDLSNLATDSTKKLTASIVAKTPGTGQVDGSSKISAGTIVTTNLNAAGGLDAGKATTVPVSFGAGLAIGVYVADLVVTDGDVTVTVPVKVTVEAPEEFAVSIKTFPDGVSDPSGANIQSVILVPTAGNTALSSGNITLTETSTGSGIWTGNAKWDGTYTVYVDGYATSTTDVKNTPVANGTASVVEKEVKDLYTVSFAKDEYKDGSNIMGNPSFVTVPASGMTVYTVVPNNDTTSGAFHAIVVPAGKTVRVSDNAYDNASGTYHYRKDGWNHYKVSTSTTAASAGIPGSGVYTVDTTAPSTTTNAPIFLDPQYVQQFKLTLGSPKNAATTPAKLGSSNYVTAKLGGGNAKQSEQANNDYVMVDANVTVTITELALFPTGDRSKYIFKTWIQDQTGATAGTFGTDASDNVTFVPKADTTISPTYWEKPTLSQKDSYHLNIPKGDPVTTAQWGFAEPKKSNNIEPYYDWTQKDATLDGTDEFQIWTDANGDGVEDAGEWITLTLGTQVVKTTPSTGVVRYTIQDSYLKFLTLPDGETNVTYKVRVKSAIDTNDTTLKADLNLAVNPDPLEEVIIRVEDGNGTTASVDDTDRDLVEYLSHKRTGIVKDNVLTWTWYYGDTAPSGVWNSNGFKKPARDQYLADANAAVAAAGGTKLSGLGISDVEDINSPTGDTAPVTENDLKGKYIYAVVSANHTGYGTVITNAIAVDYDATVTVQKDGSNVDTANGGYEVYLLLQDSGNAAGYATMPAAAKTTAWNATNKNFETTKSALTGGKTYDVYVNKVERDTTYYVKTGKTVSPTSQSATVDFYSVNAVDTTVKDAYDNSATPKNVGESFQDSDKPTTVFTTPGAGSAVITVDPSANGTNGVFKGSKVYAKTSQGTFAQDYHVDWGVTTTEPTSSTPLGYNAESSKQDKATAASTGITVTNSIEAKTWAGVQLDQNLYTVTGNIWANSTDAGIEKDSAKLTSGEYVFTGTSPNGTKGQSVTFSAKVPRSGADTSKIKDKYTITADPKTSPRSTIRGYVERQPTTADQTAISNALTSNRLDGADQNTLKAHITADNAQAFTIVVEASTYILTIPAVTGGHGKATQNWSNTGSVPPIPTGGNNFTSDAWVEDYAYASGATYTFELVNEGNTSLDVTLNVKRSNSSDNGYVYGDKAAGSSGAASGLSASGSSGDMADDVDVIFTGLATKFASLAPGAKKTFTVTIPADVAVDDTADYAFEFTSIESGTDATGATLVNGPCVVYKLTQEIKALKITDISSTAVSGGYNATGLVVKDSASSAVTLTTTQQTAEVEYKWYVTDIGVTPTLTKTGVGTLSTNASLAAGNQADGTYQTAAGDQGKSLWVVAHNKGTDNVVEAALAKVTDLPFDLDIIVKENDDKVAAANKGNYKVYLVPNTLSNPDFTADLAAQGIVEAKNTKTSTDGAYTAEGLDSKTTYKIYTNAVGGITNANWQDSTKTAALANFTGKNPPEVIYRNVILSNTTVDNQQYSAAITTNDDPFYKTVDGTTVTSIDETGLNAPTATVGATPVATSASSADRWVQSGTTVTMTYLPWTKDYALTWTGATSTGTNTPAAGDTATKQVTAKDTTIKTELKLNLYNMPVYVVGDAGGMVTEIKLSNKGAGLSFTSKADDSANSLWNGTSGALSSVTAGGAAATFKVPAGDYTITAERAAGTTIQGYRTPHNATPPSDYTGLSKDDLDVKVAATGGDANADVIVTATGQIMTVTDNAKTVDSSLENAQGAASYDSAATDGSAATTLTLPYGYTAKQLTLTVANSSSGTDIIHDVDMDDTGFTGDAKITVTGPGASAIPLDGTASMEKGNSTTATVDIAAGLDKGTYTSTLVFSFDSEDDNAATVAKMTYTLTVVVEPTKFTEVTVVDEDNATVSTVALGKDLKFSTYKTETVNDWNSTTGAPTNLVATDYTYQWYHGPADKTATETWSNTTGTASVTDATAISGATSDTLDADEIAKYPGENIYLVISAVKDKNVIEAAISAPVTTGFQPVVKISVDGTNVTTKPNDGDYVVTITDDSDATKSWKTVWDDTAKGFVPVADDGTTKVSLNATGSYTVKTNKYQGDADTTLVAHGTKLSNASASARTVTVPYFTVNAVETKDFEAITGLGETFTAMPEVEFALGGNAIADATPVLSGQKVTAKIKTAWSEDYKLTWHKAVGDATTPDPNPDPDDNAYENTAATGNNKTMTAQGNKQTAAEATAANASGEVTVSGKTYIGGRLDQNTYTITGTVVGTNTTASIIGVTVAKTDEPTKTYTWSQGDTKTEVIDPKDGDSNGILNPGDTIDFKVVKGTYTITSTADSSNTVISKVVWEPGVTGVEDTVTGPSGVLADKGVAASETKLKYNFEIHVDASALSLSVTDKTTADGDAANDITVTGAKNNPGKGTKSVEHYFSYIDKKLADATASDVITFPLKLENGGNMEMKVDLEVFHFASTSAIPDHTDQTNWEGATRVKAPEFTAGSSATASVVVPVTSASSKTVMTLTDVMKEKTPVPAKASVGGTPDAVDALTITLGKDAWSKDSGVFVFRFTGNSSAGTVHMYYVLDLTIDQLPITAVTTQLKDATGAALASTAMPGVGDKLQVEGYTDGTTAGEGLDHVTVKTSNKTTMPLDTATADAAKLTDDDVHFAWVSVPGGTANNDNGATILSKFPVNASGVLTTSVTDYQVNALDKEYTLTAADMDRDFYLIAYAPNTTAEPLKTNATDKAISAVVKAKRTVGVQIGLNGDTTNHIQPSGSSTSDPGYTVYLQEAGKPLFEADGVTLADGVLTTTWSNDSSKKYTAPIDLGKTYRVWAASYKGGTDFVDTGLVLGKNGTDTTYNQIVVYYNVTHTPNVAVNNGTLDNFASYLPGSIGTGNEANAIQKALKVEVSNSATLASVTSWATLPEPTGTDTSATVPVLKDMHVKVTVDATAASGNTTATNKTWGDAEPYHTMATTGWASGSTNTSQSGIAYPADDGSGNRLVQSGDIVVNSTKAFSAQLNQVLFTVKFVVKDNSEDLTKKGESSITAATLLADTGKGETGKVPAGGFTAVVGNGTNGKQGTDGAVVTFTNVPAGNYIVGAERGTMTKIDGYTWEDDTTVSVTGDVVAVTSTSDNANDNAKNTIQIQYSTFSVQWQDNFITNAANGTVGDAHASDFYNSNGFKKVDTAGTGPFLALTEGYSATSDTLTYKVRLVNDGVMSLSGVYIEQTDGTSDLLVDWTKVRYGKEDGTVDTITVDADNPIDTLEPSEYLEFDVKIPENQSAQSANYSDVFEMIFEKSGEANNFNPNKYTPAYQVKPAIEFAQGNSLVLYGGDHFESGTVNISKSWTTGAYNPSFVYTVANAAEVAQYLTDNPTVTLPGNFYTSDGAAVGSDATGELPGWVSVTPGTGVVTFDASEGKRADVNVQVKNDPKNFDDYNDAAKDCKVDNEIVFFIKAVDQDTNKEYFATYTINVEPGQLSLPDNTYWWDQGGDAELDERSGEPVSFRHFTYTNVVNQITEEVVASTDIAGSDANSVPNNTGLGNTDDKNKTVNVDSVHTGTWKVDKATYVLGDNVDYTFTIDYKPQDSAEKWNYKPGVATVKISAKEPDRSLKFADEIGDATDVVGAGASYHTPADDVTMVGKDSLVPQQLPLMDNTYRMNERIVYLDTEPYYDVTLEKVGGVYDVKLTVENSEGILVFALDDEGNKTTALDLEGVTLTNDTDTKTVNFRLEISDFADDPNLWVGDHHFKVTAKGYSDPGHAADATPDVEATYELILIIDPKVITKLDVKVTDGESEPDEVKGRLEGDDPKDPDQDLTTPDKKGNPPVKTTEVTWTPTDPDDQPDGKHTGVEVTVEIDPNYIYAKDDPETPDDDEDIVEHTTLTPDKPSDPDTVVVTRDEEDGDHIVHIKQTVPYLMHSDVKVGTPSDTTGPKVDDTREVGGFTTDDTNLGQYEIQLGGYPVGTPNGKVYDVEWSVDATASTLPAIGAKLVDGDGNAVDFTTLTPVDFVNSGDHLTVTLDMSEVDIPAAGTYTLTLKAEGAATKGGEKNIKSSYTITVNVTSPAPGDLKYADAKASDGSDAKGPADEVTRTIRIAKGAKPETLTAHVYDVYLSSVGHMVYGVTVQPDKELPEGWVLTPSVEAYPETVGDLPLGEAARHHHVLDLTGVNTAENGTTTVIFTAKGYSSKDLYEKSKTDATVLPDVDAIYKVEVVIYTPNTGGGNSPDPACPNQVTYLLGLYGTTNDPVMEMVANQGRVKNVPNVTTIKGYKFLGWSLTGPTGDTQADAKRKLEDPKSVTINGDTTFYAVYQPVYELGEPFHEHYVIGYPNGNFGPADNINRASVATIIARAVLPNFVEGADYGNPGGYSDVDDHWAASAIAYCSRYGVFKGYDDGTFRPDQSITRQELALVIARLSGVKSAKELPFADMADAGSWAVDGIYTAYANGWVNGYPDGTFQPLNPIRRDETVKIFNAYLYRGVNEEGLSKLTEYVHSGVASNVTENGTTEYMTWPDVPRDQWAYYEIIEAANDHEYAVDETLPKGYTLPETWDKCWIDEKWRYHDDLNDGGPTVGLLSAGFRTWNR